MKKIIGFAGKMRSGKGLASHCLRDHYGYVYVEMADKLKEICIKLLNMKNVDELDYFKNNEKEICFEFNSENCHRISELTDVPEDFIKEKALSKEITSVRGLLQFLGTDILRGYDPQWHIKHTIEKITNLIEDGRHVVIGDVRFPNEKLAIESIGGEIYYIKDKKNSINSDHPSENSLSSIDFDFEHIIYNDGLPNIDVFLYHVMDKVDKNYRDICYRK